MAAKSTTWPLLLPLIQSELFCLFFRDAADMQKFTNRIQAQIFLQVENHQHRSYFSSVCPHPQLVHPNWPQIFSYRAANNIYFCRMYVLNILISSSFVLIVCYCFSKSDKEAQKRKTNLVMRFISFCSLIRAQGSTSILAQQQNNHLYTLLTKLPGL